MSGTIQDRMKAAIEANNILIGKLEEFRRSPDMIFNAKDILRGIAATWKVAAPLIKMTSFGWLSWVLTFGGIFLEAISKEKEG